MSEYLCLNKLAWIDSSGPKKISASPAVTFLFSSPDAPRKELKAVQTSKTTDVLVPHFLTTLRDTFF